MATKTMSFSRTKDYQTTGVGDCVDFTPDSSISFGSAYKVTDFDVSFYGSLRSNTENGKNITVTVDIYTDEWISIYETTVYVPSMNSSDTVTISGSIDSEYQKNIATYGVSDIRITQVGSGRYRGYAGTGAITFQYELDGAWIKAPAITSIKNNYDGTYTINWSAANWSSGNSNVQYEVFVYKSDEYLDESPYLNTLSYTGEIPQYDVELRFYVRASLSVPPYDEISSNQSDTNSYITFYSPSLSAPTISITPTKGTAVTITRGNSVVSNGSAESIQYELYRDTVKVEKFSGSTYTIAQSTLENWNQTTIKFKIKATAFGVIPNLTTNGQLTAESSEITFIFEPYKTISYYTGDSTQGTNGWVECIVYYYTGDPTKGDNGWVECEPYYYTGNTSEGTNGWVPCSYT